MGIMRENTAYKNLKRPGRQMSHQKVLSKLLSKKERLPLGTEKSDPSLKVEAFLRSEITFQKTKKKVGRPEVAPKLKARNITVCLAVTYINFLDSFNPPIKKIQGRGRKLRFIIDEFIRMSKRQRGQLKFLQEGLHSLQDVLESFSGLVKKGEKLKLTPKEKQLITSHVNRVRLLAQLLCFTPQELKKILPRDDWNLYSFCLHWNSK